MYIYLYVSVHVASRIVDACLPVSSSVGKTQLVLAELGIKYPVKCWFHTFSHMYMYMYYYYTVYTVVLAMPKYI